MVTPASAPLPQLDFAYGGRQLADKGNRIRRLGTRRRLEHTQVWPALRYLLATAPATAASKSASSNTMNGALPPSFHGDFFDGLRTCPGQRFAHGRRPGEGQFSDPGGWAVSSPPMDWGRASHYVDYPGRDTGPPGPTRPAPVPTAGCWWQVCRRLCSPPPGRAQILRASMALGKFQGVMQATTPTGCLMHTMRLSPDGAGMVSPYTRLASSANHSI